jgi:hypothetical protein
MTSVFPDPKSGGTDHDSSVLKSAATPRQSGRDRPAAENAAGYASGRVAYRVWIERWSLHENYARIEEASLSGYRVKGDPCGKGFLMEACRGLPVATGVARQRDRSRQNSIGAPWSARCYGVARQQEGSRQNSIEQAPALTLSLGLTRARGRCWPGRGLPVATG